MQKQNVIWVMKDQTLVSSARAITQVSTEFIQPRLIVLPKIARLENNKNSRAVIYLIARSSKSEYDIMTNNKRILHAILCVCIDYKTYQPHFPPRLLFPKQLLPVILNMPCALACEALFLPYGPILATAISWISSASATNGTFYIMSSFPAIV